MALVSVSFNVVLDLINLVSVSPWLAEHSHFNQSVATLEYESVVHTSDDLLIDFVDLAEFLLELLLVGSSGSLNGPQERLFALKCGKLGLSDFSVSTDHLNH